MDANRKPRIILAVTGCVTATHIGSLVNVLCDWAEVRAIATPGAEKFLRKEHLPVSVTVYTNANEYGTWKQMGDDILHVEFQKWADILLIAPLSANTLAKVVNGLCDNLLTCIVRGWDFRKPLIVAPSMNHCMWNSPYTRSHMKLLERMGAKIVNPRVKKLSSGEEIHGAMEEPHQIDWKVRFHFDRKVASLIAKTG